MSMYYWQCCMGLNARLSIKLTCRPSGVCRRSYFVKNAHVRRMTEQCLLPRPTTCTVWSCGLQGWESTPSTREFQSVYWTKPLRQLHSTLLQNITDSLTLFDWHVGLHKAIDVALNQTFWRLLALALNMSISIAQSFKCWEKCYTFSVIYFWKFRFRQFCNMFVRISAFCFMISIDWTLSVSSLNQQVCSVAVQRLENHCRG